MNKDDAHTCNAAKSSASLIDVRSGSLAYLTRTGGTFTGEAMRQEALSRRLGDPDVVGLIHRFDHDDVLTEAEARFWDVNLLPFGWWIVSDRRA